MPLVETILFVTMISENMFYDISILTHNRRLEAYLSKWCIIFVMIHLSISTMISTNECSDGTSHGKQSILLEFYNNVNYSFYIFATNFEM